MLNPTISEKIILSNAAKIVSKLNDTLEENKTSITHCKKLLAALYNFIKLKIIHKDYENSEDLLQTIRSVVCTPSSTAFEFSKNLQSDLTKEVYIKLLEILQKIKDETKVDRGILCEINLAVFCEYFTFAINFAEYNNMEDILKRALNLPNNCNLNEQKINEPIGQVFQNSLKIVKKKLSEKNFSPNDLDQLQKIVTSIENQYRNHMETLKVQNAYLVKKEDYFTHLLLQGAKKSGVSLQRLTETSISPEAAEKIKKNCLEATTFFRAQWEEAQTAAGLVIYNSENEP